MKCSFVSADHFHRLSVHSELLSDYWNDFLWKYENKTEFYKCPNVIDNLYFYGIHFFFHLRGDVLTKLSRWRWAGEGGGFIIPLNWNWLTSSGSILSKRLWLSALVNRLYKCNHEPCNGQIRMILKLDKQRWALV